MYIVFEGVDGVGKTTLINALLNDSTFISSLEKWGYRIKMLKTPLPGTVDFSDESLLNQRFHYLYILEEMLKDPKAIIISDRSPFSLPVYNDLIDLDLFPTSQHGSGKVLGSQIMCEFIEKIEDLMLKYRGNKKALNIFYLTSLENRKPEEISEKNYTRMKQEYEAFFQNYLRENVVNINTSGVSLEKTLESLIYLIRTQLRVYEFKVTKRNKRILRIGGMPGRGKSTFADNLVYRLKTAGYNVCYLQEQLGLLLRGDVNALKRFELLELNYTSGEEINEITSKFFPSNETLDCLLYHYDYIVMDFAQYISGIFINKDYRESYLQIDQLSQRSDLKDIVAVKERHFTQRDASRPDDTMNSQLVANLEKMVAEYRLDKLEDIEPTLTRESDWVGWFESFMSN